MNSRRGKGDNSSGEGRRRKGRSRVTNYSRKGLFGNTTPNLIEGLLTPDDEIEFDPTALTYSAKGRERPNKLDEELAKASRWTTDIPLDPHEFYLRMGKITHPQTREPIDRLADYQYRVWKSIHEHKYTIIIKSQKIGLTTAVLMADFQLALLPSWHPLSCRGQEILIVGQSLDTVRQHLYSLRQMINASIYRDFMITDAEDWMQRDEVTKVDKIYIHNPDDPSKPTRIIGLGPTERGIWSWKHVKHIHVSDIAVNLPEQQETAINTLLSRLANTKGTMIIETPPRGPIGKVYEIWQKSLGRTAHEKELEGQFYPIRIHYREAMNATPPIITEDKIEEYKEILGARFSQLFEAEFSAVGGNVFDIKDIERTEMLGKGVNFNEPNPYARKIMSIDPGFGSSKYAIMITQFNDTRVEVIYAREFERARRTGMLELVYDLRRRYQIDKIFIDAANPSDIKELKMMMRDHDPDTYHETLKMARENGVSPANYMNVIPVSFSRDGGKNMLAHAQSLIEKGKVAINPAFSELVTQMRIATMVNGDLDKYSRHSLDLIDALRMNLLYYEFKRREKTTINA